MNTAPIKRVSCLNIEISENGLSEFNGGSRIIFIPKENIQSIEVGFGSSAERPRLQFVAGLMLSSLGLVGLAMVLASGMRGLRWALGFLIFGGFGVWFLYETAKQSRYLRVVCHNDERKLVFRGKCNEQEFSKFLKDAAELGYDFDRVWNPLLN